MVWFRFWAFGFCVMEWLNFFVILVNGQMVGFG